MTVDGIQAIVDHVVKALLAALHERGCVALDEEEIEKVEAVIIRSLAKSGVLN